MCRAGRECILVSFDLAGVLSFVVHEMKAMGLPVLAYDVGAQADTLVDEDRHRVVSLDMSPEDILATLTDMRSAS